MHECMGDLIEDDNDAELEHDSGNVEAETAELAMIIDLEDDDIARTGTDGKIFEIIFCIKI